jgi:hypothetical protein
VGSATDAERLGSAGPLPLLHAVSRAGTESTATPVRTARRRRRTFCCSDTGPPRCVG